MTLLRIIWPFLMLAFAFPANAHVHVQIRYTGGQGWRLGIHDFDAGYFDPAAVPLVVGAAARVPAPDSPAYTNLFGPPGVPVWILPETEKPGVLYLGIGTEGDVNSFIDGKVHLRLETLDGPGDFVLYNLDAFGRPLVQMNSRDGIALDDMITLNHPGGHAHLNWAFTAPGTYRVGFSARGRLAGGLEASSGVVFYTFLVRPPAAPRLTVARPEADGRLRIAIIGEPNVAYVLEASSDLDHWTAVGIIASQTGGSTFIATNSDSRRFYRVVLP